jgi:hypothetical protein
MAHGQDKALWQIDRVRTSVTETPDPLDGLYIDADGMLRREEEWPEIIDDE